MTAKEAGNRVASCDHWRVQLGMVYSLIRELIELAKWRSMIRHLTRLSEAKPESFMFRSSQKTTRAQAEASALLGEGAARPAGMNF